MTRLRHVEESIRLGAVSIRVTYRLSIGAWRGPLGLLVRGARTPVRVDVVAPWGSVQMELAAEAEADGPSPGGAGRREDRAASSCGRA